MNFVHDISISSARRIGIIGGGLAGTFVAAAIARAAREPVLVDLIEASGEFGPGRAYSTTDERHLLNVPAARVSARVDDPEHFLRFARGIDREAEPGDFLPRAWYGTYLREQLAEAEAAIAEHGGSIERVGETAVALRAGLASGRGRVERAEFADGSTRVYDDVVLALGNLAGGAPVAIPDDPRAFTSPWQPGALDVSGISAGEPYKVLLIGTALTSVDAALTLTSGHESVHVCAVSRTGKLPFPHLDGPLREIAQGPAWAGETGLSADELVARVHEHIAAAEANGYAWQDAVDGIRKVVTKLWQALETREQANFLRHHLRDWELRRHRMAPQIGRRIEQLRYDERLHIGSGGVHDIVVEHGKLVVTRDPHGDLPRRETFDRIIDCTGACTDVTRTTNPLVLQMLHDGRVQPDAHRRGFRTDGAGTLLDGAGAVSPQLHGLGLMRRGELWETTGIAEIRDQADALGALLAARQLAGVDAD